VNSEIATFLLGLRQVGIILKPVKSPVLTMADTHHSPVYTKSPIAAGKVFLKAALFDTVTPPAAERFVTKQYEWVSLEQITVKL
jgi:hypothetical protein